MPDVVGDLYIRPFNVRHNRTTDRDLQQRRMARVTYIILKDDAKLYRLTHPSQYQMKHSSRDEKKKLAPCRAH